MPIDQAEPAGARQANARFTGAKIVTMLPAARLPPPDPIAGVSLNEPGRPRVSDRDP